MLRTTQRLLYTLSLVAFMIFTQRVWAENMEFVKVAPDKRGFILSPSGNRYVPWGNNYGSVDIMQRLAEDAGRVEREFAEMRAAGATVARIHPEMPRILTGPNKADPKSLERLGQLLKIAETSGIHLKITGLACYKINDRLAWYDSMEEEERWRTQAFFWETIAQTCEQSAAVFAYDLVNEPAAIGETFPLNCGVDDERDFLLKSRAYAHGWMGHWPDQTPAELHELKTSGNATIENAIWLAWVELFQEMGQQMTGQVTK